MGDLQNGVWTPKVGESGQNLQTVAGSLRAKTFTIGSGFSPIVNYLHFKIRLYKLNIVSSKIKYTI